MRRSVQKVVGAVSSDEIHKLVYPHASYHSEKQCLVSIVRRCCWSLQCDTPLCIAQLKFPPSLPPSLPSFLSCFSLSPLSLSLHLDALQSALHFWFCVSRMQRCDDHVSNIPTTAVSWHTVAPVTSGLIMKAIVFASCKSSAAALLWSLARDLSNQTLSILGAVGFDAASTVTHEIKSLHSRWSA